MKRLIIIRHAKSSWEDFSVNDHDRPLNDRGIMDSAKMAAFLKNTGIKISLFLSSTATRAHTTAQYFAITLDYPVDKIELVPSFYSFFDNGDQILSLLKKLDNSIQNVAIFGHNETFFNLAHNLSHSKISKFPTCAIASIIFEVDSWSKIHKGSSILEFFISPKSLNLH